MAGRPKKEDSRDNQYRVRLNDEISVRVRCHLCKRLKKPCRQFKRGLLASRYSAGAAEGEYHFL